LVSILHPYQLFSLCLRNHSHSDKQSRFRSPNPRLLVNDPATIEEGIGCGYAAAENCRPDMASGGLPAFAGQTAALQSSEYE